MSEEGGDWENDVSRGGREQRGCVCLREGVRAGGAGLALRLRYRSATPRGDDGASTRLRATPFSSGR